MTVVWPPNPKLVTGLRELRPFCSQPAASDLRLSIRITFVPPHQNLRDAWVSLDRVPRGDRGAATPTLLDRCSKGARGIGSTKELRPTDSEGVNIQEFNLFYAISVSLRSTRFHYGVRTENSHLQR